MATSKVEYHRECIDQVLRLLELRPTAQERQRWDALRERIDLAPDHTSLFVAVADFWLDLDQYEGAWRRRQPEPPSPFQRKGRKQVAEKGLIAAWHDAHEAMDLQRKLAMQLRQKRDLARTDAGRKVYDILEKLNQEWLVQNGKIVGHLTFLPQGVDLDDIGALDIERLPLDQALRRSWVDRAEASLWLAILAGCQRMRLADLEQIQLEHGTSEAPSGPKRRQPLRT